MKEDLMRDLAAWLTRDGNSDAKLAAELGLRTSTAVSNWRRRESVPAKWHEAVRKIVKKGK